MLSRSINSEKNKLWFLNVNLEVLESIRTFADDKFFHFLDDEEEISICYGAFYTDINISNYSFVNCSKIYFFQTIH